MNDLSSMIAAYRHKHGIEASVSDEAVKNLMKTDGTLTAGELAMLEETFGKKGGEEPIGDTIIGMDKGEPEMPKSEKGFWIAAGVATLGIATAVGKRFGVNVPQLAKTLGFAGAAGALLASCSKDDSYYNNTELEQDFTGIAQALKEMAKEICNRIDAHKENDDKWNAALLNALTTLNNSVKNMDAKQQEQMNKVLDKMDALAKQNGKIGDDIQALLKDVLNAINTVDANNQEGRNKLDKIITLLTNIKADGSESSQKTIELLNMLLNQVTTNGQISENSFNAIYDILKDIQSSGGEYGEKILSLLNDMMTSVNQGNKIDENGFKTVCDILKDIKNNNNTTNQGLVEILTSMWADIVAGQKGTIDAINELKKSNLAGNQDIQALIKDLYADSQISADARSQEILAAINNVAAVVENLKGAVDKAGDAISASIKGLEFNLDNLYNAFLDGNKTQAEVLGGIKTIIAQLKEGNVLSESTNKLLAELLKKADNIGPNGDIKDYSEVLNEILTAIKDVVVGVEDLKIGIGENNGNIIAELREIKENQKYQSSQLDAYAKQSAEQNEKLVAKGDEILAAIKGLHINVEGSNVDVEGIVKAIKEHDANLAAQFEALAGTLGVKLDDNGKSIVDAINGLKGNIDAVKDAINNIKLVGGSSGVDLTKTNNLIQTVINLLSEDTDDSPVDMSTVTALLTENNRLMEALLEKEGPDMSAFMEALKGIEDAIKNISISGGSSVDLTKTNNLIQSCINLLTELVDSQADQARTYGTQLAEAVSTLKSDPVSTNSKLEEIKSALEGLKG